MNTLTIFREQHFKTAVKMLKFGVFTLLAWLLIPIGIRLYYPTAGLIDPGILQVILLAMITWVILLTISMLFIRQVYLKLTLPNGQDIVSHFNLLLPWQQLALYLALYALLVFSATACLSAIC